MPTRLKMAASPHHSWRGCFEGQACNPARGPNVDLILGVVGT